MVWVILTLSKIEALLAFSRAHFGHDYHKMLKIVIPNAGSTCCPIHLKQAERPSHIDKQGNADTTADTGAKLKKNFNFGSDDISRHETYDYEGIKIQNLSDWLLKIE